MIFVQDANNDRLIRFQKTDAGEIQWNLEYQTKLNSLETLASFLQGQSLKRSNKKTVHQALSTTLFIIFILSSVASSSKKEESVKKK